VSESGVLDGGGPAMRGRCLRRHQRNEAAAGGVVQLGLDVDFGVGDRSGFEPQVGDNVVRAAGFSPNFQRNFMVQLSPGTWGDAVGRNWADDIQTLLQDRSQRDRPPPVDSLATTASSTLCSASLSLPRCKRGFLASGLASKHAIPATSFPTAGGSASSLHGARPKPRCLRGVSAAPPRALYVDGSDGGIVALQDSELQDRVVTDSCLWQV